MSINNIRARDPVGIDSTGGSKVIKHEGYISLFDRWVAVDHESNLTVDLVNFRDIGGRFDIHKMESAKPTQLMKNYAGCRGGLLASVEV